ncbi:hypothetical protein AABB87_03535 [Roseateles sp. PN1]
MSTAPGDTQGEQIGVALRTSLVPDNASGWRSTKVEPLTQRPHLAASFSFRNTVVGPVDTPNKLEKLEVNPTSAKTQHYKLD